MILRILLALGLVLTGLTAKGAAGLERRTWTIDGIPREALVHIPAQTGPGGAPLIFAFHGHGGSMAHASRSFPLHRQWPEAIVVYPQGLPTASRLVDPEGKQSGWQGIAGVLGDRDLKFFDGMLADLRKNLPVDPKRIYSTGHSNGGGFTYLLWAERGATFAALAPSSAVLARGYQKFQPKPLLHIGSPQDELVNFSWQTRMLDLVLKVNGCGTRKRDRPGYTVYPSSKGAEVAIYLHAGGHKYPAAATEVIVKFFQAHAKK